ncbi:MAG: hypothetical protein COB50_05415 [Thiotrichales bacterium]|nr:MAG: hypothetical protein COB50_05415 [Thiotrichales bacterium]
MGIGTISQANTKLITDFIKQKPGHRQYWHNVDTLNTAMQIANTYKQHKGTVFVVTADMQKAYELAGYLKFFLIYEDAVNLFPDLEILPYDKFSPHPDIIASRIKVLQKLRKNFSGIIISSAQNLFRYLPPKEYVGQFSLSYAVGDVLDLPKESEYLAEMGYSKMQQIRGPGEFAVRGSIFDIFPINSKNPLRLDLFDNEIDSIRVFDVETQRSIKKVENFGVFPNHEFSLDKASCTRFIYNWQTHFPRADKSIMLDAVKQQKAAPGLENYLPLFFEEVNTLFDYIAEDALCVHVGDTIKQAENFWQQVRERHQQYAADIQLPLLLPEQAFYVVDKVFQSFRKYSELHINNGNVKDKSNHIQFDGNELPELRANFSSKHPFSNLQKLFKQYPDYKILFVADSNGRCEILQQHLRRSDIQTVLVDSWTEFLKIDMTQQRCYLLCAEVYDSAILQELKTVLISEQQLFDKKIVQRAKSSSKTKEKGIKIYDVGELKVDTLVVHFEYGIGRYLGLNNIESDGISSEYLTVEYADKDMIYVPVQDLHLISRYSSANLDNVALHTLGTDKWLKPESVRLKRFGIWRQSY